MNRRVSRMALGNGMSVGTDDCEQRLGHTTSWSDEYDHATDSQYCDAKQRSQLELNPLQGYHDLARVLCQQVLKG